MMWSVSCGLSTVAQRLAASGRYDALVALVEPAVLLLMGGIVMLLVLAILLPIVNLNNLVN